MEQAGTGSVHDGGAGHLVDGRRARTGPLVAALVMIAVAGALLASTLVVSGTANPGTANPGTAPSVTALERPTAVLDSRPLYTCRGYSSLPRQNPRDQVLRDMFAWGRYEPVSVGDGSGDIDWTLDPYEQVSWRMWFHSLRWLGAAIDAGDREGLARVVAVTKDWVRDNPYPWNADPVAQEPTMHRTNTLLCLRQALAQQAGGMLPAEHVWIDAALQDHARSLEKNFSQRGNHGTDEAIALLGVGCTLRLPHYTDLAVTRLGNYLKGSIDEQGATDEQATGYGYFNRALWAAAGERTAVCAPDAPVTGLVSERVEALAEFLAHATTPLGPFHQLGNTQFTKESPIRGTAQEYAITGGQAGAPPADRVKVYDAGYVFGRSGWGTGPVPFAQESAYSLRFGPKRVLHGHDDHTSITWQVRGRQILRDTGYGEYTRDRWETYVKSPQAHNQLVVSGQGAATETALTGSRITDGFGSAGRGTADSYTLSDEPVEGVDRVRDVIVLTEPDIVLVADRATAHGKRTFTQYWHLPDQATTVNRARTRVTATAGDTRTTVLQLPYRRTRMPTGTATVTKGATDPILGWYWPTIFTRSPAPTVAFERTGTSAAMVTAVAAGPVEDEFTVTVRRSGDDWIYGFSLGDTVAEVALAPDGTLRRVS